ncbi:MAG: MATE family efflux transporter [Planctomycetes bacterium]|nr:MATE family efflux transporter [Planctomycetota bacterium]
MEDARLAGDLNRGRLLPRLFTFGIPLVLGMFFHSLFNLADLIIVGKLGPWALAAVNQASLVGFVPMLICTGVNTASIAIISRNFGMRNYRRANANALQAFLLLLFLSVALGFPSYWWADLLNRLVGSTGDALPAANDYLRITSAGMFTMFLLMQVTAQLRAGGNARWPMILLIGANVLNVVLTIGLVYGLWGLPRLEVAGAAWGTVIARGLFAVFGLYLVTRHAAPVRLDLRRIRLRGRMIWNLTRLGIPSSLQFVVRVVGYGAILNLVTRFGRAEDMHAALAVGFRLDLLAIFTGAGWGGAAAAMVGQALGARQQGRAERAGWVAVLFDVATMVGIGVAYWIYAHWLVSFFGEDPAKDPQFEAMHAMGVEYVRITVWAYAFAGVAITLAHALNGAGSTKTPLLLDSIVLVIQLPVAAFVCLNHREHGYGPQDLWWSLVLTTVIAAALYALVWERGHWKHKSVQ